MEKTPEKYIERLLEASNKKHVLLQDMLLLTYAQTESLTEDGVEALEKIIDNKQQKIDEIDKIDEEFDVYFQRLKQEKKIKSLDELQSLNFRGIKELQASISEIVNLIKEISEIEQQNNEKAKKLISEFGNEIKKLAQNKKANSAYKPGLNMQPPSYFIDKKK